MFGMCGPRAIALASPENRERRPVLLFDTTVPNLSPALRGYVRELLQWTHERWLVEISSVVSGSSLLAAGRRTLFADWLECQRLPTSVRNEASVVTRAARDSQSMLGLLKSLRVMMRASSPDSFNRVGIFSEPTFIAEKKTGLSRDNGFGLATTHFDQVAECSEQVSRMLPQGASAFLGSEKSEARFWSRDEAEPFWSLRLFRILDSCSLLAR